jgi:hypothetical protein
MSRTDILSKSGARCLGLLAAILLSVPAATQEEDPCGDARYHAADANGDYAVSLTELLRQIQFFNSGGYRYCPDAGTEDDYCPGPAPGKTAFPCESKAIHDTDQNGNEAIELNELLRIIQFYNTGALFYCPGRATEDEFCPGAPDGGISLSPKEALLGVGGGVYLEAVSTDTQEGIRWETSAPEIATVEETGAVVAVAPGVVRIRATGEESDAWAEAEIVVSSATLTVTPEVVFLHPATMVTLLPVSSAGGDTFDFNSDNGGIASINGNGEVSANGEGETTLTVTSALTGLSVAVPVTVLPEDALIPEPGRSTVSFEASEDRPYDPVVRVTLEDNEVYMLQDLADSDLYNDRFEEILSGPEEEGQSSRAARGSFVVPTIRPATRYVNHAVFQTPIKDQRDRNTCSLFCLVSALEARYKRAGYGDLDLSEQHFNHMGKTVWLHGFVDEARPRGVYENQLGMTSGGGVYAVAMLTRYGLPLESVVPYEHSRKAGHVFEDYHNIRQEGDNPIVMEGLTRQDLTQREINDFNLEESFTTWNIPRNYSFAPLAKEALGTGQYGVTTYEKCPPERIKDITWWENVLHMGYEIAFQANMVWDTLDGVWVARNAMPDEPVGSHCMVAVGYDRRVPWAPYLIVKNQWGESGFLKLDYNWVTGSFTGTMTHAIVITGITNPEDKRFKAQTAVGRWTIETDLYTDPGQLDIFRQAQFFPPSDINGFQDRRLGEFYDAAGNAFKINGFAFPNFAEWYLDPANPNAEFDDIGGNRFFGFYDVDFPELMAGYYVPVSGPVRGFYGYKHGLIETRSVYTSVASDDAFLGRWEIIHGKTDGYVEVTEVGNSPPIVSVTYESPAGARFSYGGTASHTTGEVEIGLSNVLVANKGTFVGHILATNPGIMAGYFQPQTGARSGMVLRRVNYARLGVTLNEPVSNASFLTGATVGLQADVFGDGLHVSNPDLVTWSTGAPADEGGLLLGNGVSRNWIPQEPGTYEIFVVYTEGALTGPGTRAVDQVTVTVRDASAPEVTITSPADGATYSEIKDPAVISVNFAGVANDVDDGQFPGSELNWSYRRQGAGAWISAGTGASKSISLQDELCFEFTYYEIRLQATDSDGLTGTDIITVGVDALFCR